MLTLSAGDSLGGGSYWPLSSRRAMKQSTAAATFYCSPSPLSLSRPRAHPKPLGKIVNRSQIAVVKSFEMLVSAHQAISTHLPEIHAR